MRGSPKPDGTERPKRKRLGAPARDHLHGQAALEKALVLAFEVGELDALGGDQRRDEGLVLFPVEGAVDVIARLALAFAPPRGAEGDAHVDAVGFHDRRQGVIEIQVLPSRDLRDWLGERRTRKGSRGNDRRPVGQGARLLPHHLDEGMAPDRRRGGRGKRLPVHCQGPARRHGGLAGDLEEERSKPPELRLQQAAGPVGQVASQRVGAHQLGEVARAMGAGPDLRAHLEQAHRHPEPGRRPGGFGPGEAAADHGEERMGCRHGGQYTVSRLSALGRTGERAGTLPLNAIGGGRPEGRRRRRCGCAGN